MMKKEVMLNEIQKCLASRNLQEAQKLSKKGIKLFKGDPDFYHNASMALMALKKMKEAYIYLERALAQNSKSPLYLMTLGMWYYLNDDSQKASLAFQDGLNYCILNPGSSDKLFFGITSQLIHMNFYELALESITEFEKRGGSELVFYLVKAAILETLANQEHISYEEPLAAYEKAKELAPMSYLANLGCLICAYHFGESWKTNLAATLLHGAEITEIDAMIMKLFPVKKACDLRMSLQQDQNENLFKKVA